MINNDTLLDYIKLSAKIIDTDKYIKIHDIKKITSYQIYETGSNTFNKEGLFSEMIFGSITSPDRMTKFGYIDLHCDILQPVIYYILKSIKRFYIDILNGTKYAIFDNKTNNFELALEDDKNADTGFSFFISHLYDLVIPNTKSSIKQQYIEVFNKYKNQHVLTTNKFLVMPAGLREITKDTKKLSKDSINQMYINILSLSNAIDIKLQKDKIYDRVKQMIQAKTIDIFDYITNILKGDNGFLLEKYADRYITFGTRNVSSIDIKSSNTVDNKSNLSPNEVGISLYQCLKAYQPFIIHNFKNYMSAIINNISKVCNVTNLNDFKQTTIHTTSKTIYKFTDYTGIESIINDMQYENFRNKPILLKDDKDIEYTILIKYDLDNLIFWISNIDELEKLLNEHYNLKIDNKKIKPITWYEFFYFISYTTLENKNKTGLVTRYPVINPNSINANYVNIYTTFPSRNVTLVLKNNNKIELPRYPILNKKSIESIIVNTLTCKNFGLDFDGDTQSFSGIYAEDSNDEIQDHLKSYNAILTNSGEFSYIEEDNSKMIVKALSYKP